MSNGRYFSPEKIENTRGENRDDSYQMLKREIDYTRPYLELSMLLGFPLLHLQADKILVRQPKAA
jgi:hypothetical protein